MKAFIRLLVSPLLLAFCMVVLPSFGQVTSSQIITWTGTTNEILALKRPYPLGATARSGLPLTLKVLAGPALLEGGTITVTNLGTVWVRAEITEAGASPGQFEDRVFNATSIGMTRLGTIAAGGYDKVVKIEGDLAYVLSSVDGMQVFDVSNPLAPTRVGGLAIAGSPYIAQVVGQRAYVGTTAGGLLAVDVSNPSTPRMLAAFKTAGEVKDIFVVGNLAFVASGVAGLHIVDFNDPSQPNLLGWCGTQGSAVGVEVAGGRAYVAELGNGVEVIDVSDPGKPYPLGHYASKSEITSVHFLGKGACLAESNIRLEVVDFSEPSKPVLVGQFFDPYHRGKAHVVGEYAFLPEGEKGLKVVSLSNPNAIALAGSHDGNQAATQVFVGGGRAYLTEWNRGIQILALRQAYPNPFDFVPPKDVVVTNTLVALPQRSGSGGLVTYSIVAGPARVESDRLIFTGPGEVKLRATQEFDGMHLPIDGEWTIHVRLIEQNISWSGDASATLPINSRMALGASASSGLPVQLRVESGPALLAGGFLVATNVGTIWVSAEQEGDGVHAPARVFRSLNVRTPSLKLESKLMTAGFTSGIHGAGSLIAMASGSAGLQLIDVSDPKNPLLVGSLPSIGNARGVQVREHLAYIAVDSEGLAIVDIADPTRPVRVGGLPTGGTATSVALGDGAAFIGDSTVGLVIIDVSVPSQPFSLGVHKSPGMVRSIAVSSNLVFLARGEAGFEIVDAAVRSNPVLVASVRTMAFASSVWVVDGYAYVASRYDGLMVFDVRNPASPLLVGKYSSLQPVGNLRLKNGYAYLPFADGHVEVVDVSNPGVPILVGSLKVDSIPLDLEVLEVGSIAISSPTSLQVVNLSWGLINTLDFSPPYSVVVTNRFVDLPAKSSNGENVQYSVLSGPARVMGNSLILDGAGLVRLRAGQADDGIFLPVDSEWTINVVPAAQEIHWQISTNALLPLNSAVPWSVSSSSGLPVAVKVAAGPAMIQGGILMVTNVGTVVVMAEQQGDANYYPARIQRTYNVRQVRLDQIGAYNNSDSTVAVRVRGKFAFLTCGNTGMEVLDVSDPTNPVRIGRVSLDGNGNGMTLEGDFVYVAAGRRGLRIVNVSNPERPSLMGTVRIGEFAVGLDVGGGYAYVAGGDSGLHVINVRDPRFPFLVGQLDIAGSASSVQIREKTAFVVDGYGGVQAIAVDKPDAPARLWGVGMTSSAAGVRVDRGLLYVADLFGGLGVINVGDPRRPSILTGGYFYYSDPRGPVEPNGHGSAPLGLRVTNNFVYQACGLAGVKVWDVSSPASPLTVGGFKTSGRTLDVDVAGERLYVANDSSGLAILEIQRGYSNFFNFSPPSDMSVNAKAIVLPQISGNGNVVEYAVKNGPARVEDGRLVFTGAGSVRFSANQPEDGEFLPVRSEWVINIHGLPQTITWTGIARDAVPLNEKSPMGAISSSGLPVSIRVESGPGEYKDGFLTATSLGTIVVVAEQPGNGVYAKVVHRRSLNVGAVQFSVLGSQAVFKFTHGLDIAEGVGIVLSESKALLFDINDPANPVQIGEYSAGGLVLDAWMSGKLAYLGVQMSGLLVLDISNPAKPVRLATVDTVRSVRRMQHEANYLYAITDDHGLEVLDLTNPASPVEVGSLAVEGGVFDIVVAGRYAYGACGYRGLTVIDVENPAKPRLIGRLDMVGFVGVLAIGDGFLYVSTGESGFHVFELSDPTQPLLRGSCAMPQFLINFVLVGKHAFLAGESEGIVVIDVANPDNPVTVGRFAEQVYPYEARVRGDNAFVAGGSAGFSVLRIKTSFPQEFQSGLQQTIPFQSEPIPLKISSTSRLPVVSALVSGPATVENDQLILTGLGQVKLHAEQAGDDDYLPASVDWTITVTPPEVRARLLDGAVELSWAAGIEGMQLQARESLSTEGFWVDVAEQPVMENSEAKVRLGRSERERYFRLIKR